MSLRMVALVLIALQAWSGVAVAFPHGGAVVGGDAAIGQPIANTLRIYQTTDKAIIHWKGFDIDVNQLVQFLQPSANAAILNRVTGGDPSAILGQLKANGRVFLLNPNGIVFGPGAVIDAAGLVATTFNIQDGEFMAGKLAFEHDSTKFASIVNKGEIKVADNGFVVLVAPGVSNEGLIIANLGTVALATGQKFTLDFAGDGLIGLVVDGKVMQRVVGPDGQPLPAAVTNAGKIKADGGHVLLTARVADDVWAAAVNQSGIIEARSLVARGGVIRLEASSAVVNHGVVGKE
jgi:filamentous hemagglutinin family protein